MGSQPAKSSVKNVATLDAKLEDAVLVFGATGKLGRLVVKEVLFPRPPTLEIKSVQICPECYMLWVFLTASAWSSDPGPSSPGHASCAHNRPCHGSGGHAQ